MAIRFKENLKTIRKAYGLSQREMADRLNIPEKRYQSYEEGRGEPGMAELSRFCCIVNFTIDQMVEWLIEAKFTDIQISQHALKKPKHQKD